MALTERQRAEREHYIGGSDAPAIAGVNPPRWAQPIDVYLEKIGEAPPRDESGGRGRMMALGSLMEEVVAGLAGEAAQVRWRRPARTYRSRRYPWAAGNVDRIAQWSASSAIPPGSLLEAKWSQRADGWGTGWQMNDDGSIIAPPKLEVPLHYLVQVQHYLAVADRKVAILAVLLGYADFRWYRIARNDEIVGWLMQLEEEFWREHVEKREPPEPDGSEAWSKHLRRSLAESQPAQLVATPEQQALAAQLRQALLNERAAAQARARVEQLLQRSMGTAEQLIFPGGSITWRQNRPGLKVEWEALANRLLRQAYVLGDDGPEFNDWLLERLPREWPKTKKAQSELIREVATHLELTSTTPGARPWAPKFDEDQEEDTDAAATA